jgi:hypothetical protein
MAKRKNKKMLTKWDFTGMLCTQCMLCREGTEPEFCYQHVYKQNPKRFIELVFPRLLKAGERIMDGDFDGEANPAKEMNKLFDFVFSIVHFQNRNAARIDFANQVTAPTFSPSSRKKTDKQLAREERTAKRKAKKAKKGKKGKKRYIVAAYPTFFCSGGMKEEIRSIIDADNYQQQDKAEECTGGDAADSNAASSDAKS